MLNIAIHLLTQLVIHHPSKRPTQTPNRKGKSHSTNTQPRYFSTKFAHSKQVLPMCPCVMFQPPTQPSSLIIKHLCESSL